MIVADTSSLVAVVLGESDAERHLAELVRERCLVSAATVVEATIVVEARQGPDATRDLEHLIASVADRIVPVDADHAAAAIGAWRRFGKGRHPAGLSYGDCCSYATAQLAGLPLLFKGDAFSQTDVSSVL